MPLERQKRLLALLDAHGGDVGNLDFQKLLFLFCNEVEDSPSYEFVPYKFGGFSFTSYADRRRLTEQGLLANEDRIWKLTPAGKSVATVGPLLRMKMDRFAKQLSHLRGDALVAETYRRHPYHASRSEIAERVLAGDKLTLLSIEGARPSARRQQLCTVGYEGRSLEAYLNLLLKAGVTLLCDVRRNPLSRKYGFSKRTLSTSCEAVGIRYEHLPELGIPSQERRDLNTQSDYDALFSVYERDNLPQQGESLNRIKKWLSSGECVALTCYEHSPCQCHRHCVAEALERDGGRRAPAIHL